MDIKLITQLAMVPRGDTRLFPTDSARARHDHIRGVVGQEGGAPHKDAFVPRSPPDAEGAGARPVLAGAPGEGQGGDGVAEHPADGLVLGKGLCVPATDDTLAMRACPDVIADAGDVGNVLNAECGLWAPLCDVPHRDKAEAVVERPHLVFRNYELVDLGIYALL